MKRFTRPVPSHARPPAWGAPLLAIATLLLAGALTACGDSGSEPGDAALGRAERLLVAAERFEGRGASAPGLALRYAAAVALAGGANTRVTVGGDLTGQVDAVAVQIVDITGSGAAEDTTVTNWLVAHQDTAVVIWAFGRFGSGSFDLLTAAGGIFVAPAALWEIYEGDVEYSGMTVGAECELTAAREAALVRALDRVQAGITVACRRASFNAYLNIDASNPVNVEGNTASDSWRLEFEPATTLLPGARLEIRRVQ